MSQIQRVQFDLSGEWEYALPSPTDDTQPGVFSASPVFTVDKLGRPLVINTQYYFYARNQTLEPDPLLYSFTVLASGQVLINYAGIEGQLATSEATALHQVGDGVYNQALLTGGNAYALGSGQKNLLRLTQEATGIDQQTVLNLLIAAHTISTSMVFGGADTRLFHVSGPDDTAETGSYFQTHDALGNFLRRYGFMGRFPDGSFGISSGDLGGKLALFAQELQLQFTKIFASGSLRAKLFASTSLPVTTNASLPLVAEYDPVLQEYDYKAVSMSTQAQLLLPLVLPLLQPTIDAAIRAGLQGDNETVSVYQVCIIKRNVPADTVNKFTITANQVGVVLDHNLQTTAEHIFPLLLDANNQPDTVMILTLISNDSYRIDYPAGLSSGYGGGKLKLERTDA